MITLEELLLHKDIVKNYDFYRSKFNYKEKYYDDMILIEKKIFRQYIVDKIKDRKYCNVWLELSKENITDKILQLLSEWIYIKKFAKYMCIISEKITNYNRDYLSDEYNLHIRVIESNKQFIDNLKKTKEDIEKKIKSAIDESINVKLCFKWKKIKEKFMLFTVDEIFDHINIQENYNFYQSRFSTNQKYYNEMCLEEKNIFKQYVKDNYYDELDLNDEIVERREEILQILSTWIITRDFAQYMSEINEAIIYYHSDDTYSRLGEDNLDPNIRLKNTQVIEEIYKEIDKIKTMAKNSIKSFVDQKFRYKRQKLNQL